MCAISASTMAGSIKRVHRYRRDGVLKPRGTVDDEELWPPQATFDKVVDHGAPGFGALSAHGLDREQHLLAVCTHADDDEQRAAKMIFNQPSVTVSRGINL
jgi:hypothetical protein